MVLLGGALSAAQCYAPVCGGSGVGLKDVCQRLGRKDSALQHGLELKLSARLHHGTLQTGATWSGKMGIL